MDRLGEALAKLDASIEATLTPEQALARRRQIEATERKERGLARTLTGECANAIESLAHAIQYPTICMTDIEQAIDHCQKALAAAKELDK